MSGWIKKILLIGFSLGVVLSYSSAALGQDTLGSKIIVNIPAMELSLFQNGTLIYRFPIAVGSPMYETPVGLTELKKIVWNPWWFPPNSAWAVDYRDTPPGPENPLGPVKMELKGTLRLHGNNDEQTIGQAVSHGCVRLFNADAKTLAWWIQSHFTQKQSLSLLSEYETQKEKSYSVLLDHSLTVDIRYDLVEVVDNALKIHPDIYRKTSDLKQLVYETLSERGVKPEQINQRSLQRFLSGLKEETISVSLKELTSHKERLALR